MEKFYCNILDIKDEVNDIVTYTLSKPEGIHWTPGSMTHIALEGHEDIKGLVRHMSIVSDSDEDVVVFTTRKVITSEFKEKLSKLTVGDQIVTFSYSNHVELQRKDVSQIFLTMGVGIVTIRPILQSITKDQSGVPSVISINVSKPIARLYEKELSELPIDNYRHQYVNNRDEFSEQLMQVIDKTANYTIIGSDQFLRNTIKQLRSQGIKPEQIVIDRRENHRFMYNLTDDSFSPELKED